MSTPAPSESSRSPAKCNLNLQGEAQHFFRQRIRVAGIGIVLGVAFVGIGTIEVYRLATSSFTPEYLIALLLEVLGIALIVVCLYSGLLNPVTRIRANASGVTFERRWGKSLTWGWKDPYFRLDIDDRALDPEGSDESRQHLFFEGPGMIYGSLTPATLGPLLDTARAFGAPVTEKQLEQRERGRVHLVRRIRIRPLPMG